MDVVKRSKTPDGYDIVLEDWKYPHHSPLDRYAVAVFRPAKGDSNRKFGPSDGQTWRWQFNAKTIEQADEMLEEIQNGAPLSDFLKHYKGSYAHLM